MIEMDNNTFMAIAVVAPIAGYVCTQFARRPRRDAAPSTTEVTARLAADAELLAETARIAADLRDLRALLEREARANGFQVTAQAEDRGRM